MDQPPTNNNQQPTTNNQQASVSDAWMTHANRVAIEKSTEHKQPQRGGADENNRK
jgi:hypothetical protein